MDKLTAMLHVNGRQPVEVEIAVSDVLAVDGPGNIRFVLEPVGFTLGVNQADQEITTIPDEELIVPPADALPVQDDTKTELSAAQLWQIIYTRFINSPALASDSYLMRAVTEEYTRAVKAEGQLSKMQKGIEGPADRASQDAAILFPVADKLLNKKGEWNKSEIARQLNMRQTGGAYGDRITKAIAELERMIRAAEPERRAA